MSQSEEDLRHLEDEREVDRGHSRRPQSVADLPKPLYRLKAMHSNETFFAYFPGFYSPEAEAAPAPETAAPDRSGAGEGGTAAAPAEAVAYAATSTAEGAAPAEAALFGGAAPVEEPPLSAEAGEASSEPPAARSEPPAGEIPPRSMVVAPTRYGRDICEVQGTVKEPGPIGMEDLVKIERVATSEDLKKVEANREREHKAFEACKQRIAARNLPMKLVSAHYLLEEPKVLFYFSAESRVDFRELVKDLVSVFKMRIELRQIGVRDEARVTGGCGVCGRVLCCHGVTDKLTPVSIKMAKDQNLSLNSMKISGPCGRLLCCLAYEYGFYRDARRELPNEGARFPYDGTQFRVIEVNALAGTVKMAGEDGRLLDMSSTRFAYAEGRWQIRPESPDLPAP
ncbi:MAG TPA: regulatory iron-sulfur-containing complex subunit RicT [Rectinemataceae bacterium]|nr:regulatory iron-sulfur-containing complex subunit RicT [Rectinemataceae bacterium]